MQNFKKVNYIIIILGLAAILICMQSPLNFLSSGNTSTDSSVFKYVALAMQQGQVPYKDTFDHKGPLIYLINYLGMLILYNRGIWLLEILSMIVSVFLAYKIVRRYAGRCASCITVLITFSMLGQYFQGGNFTEEWALPFILIGLYYFVQYFLNDTIYKRGIILCGAACGAVLMLRVNMIAIWLAFALIICGQLIYTKSWKKLLSYILHFTIGNLLVIVPFIIYLVCHGAFIDFIEQYIIFNFSYSSVSSLDKWNAFLYFAEQPVIYLSIAVFIFIYCVKREQTKQYKGIYFGTLFFLILTILLICISGRNYGHYGIILIPAVLLPIGYLIQECTVVLQREKTISAGAFVMLFYCIIAIGLPNWVQCINNIIDIKMNNYSIELAKIVDLIEDNTEAEEQISVFGNENYLYCRTRRLSASKYSYQFPLIAVDENIFSEYMEDIMENSPKVVIISEMGGYRFEEYKSKLVYYLQGSGYEQFYKSQEERMDLYRLIE